MSDIIKRVKRFTTATGVERFRLITCLTVICLLFLPSVIIPAPQLSSNPPLSTDGYFILHWDSDLSLPDASLFTLRESETEKIKDSRIIYKGPDKARTISGKKNGEYYYWIIQDQNESGDQPGQISVVVKHHSMTRALGIMFTGAIVFIFTFILIISGHKKQRSRGGKISE